MKKIHITNALFLAIMLLSIVLVYFQVTRLVRHNIEEELNHITNISISAVKSSVDMSIKNYLRGAAEMNREIVSFYHEQHQKGLITEREAKARAGQVLNSQIIGKTGYFYVIDSHGIVLLHPTPIVGENMADQFDFVTQQTIDKWGYLEYDWTDFGKEEERPKALYMAYFEPWDWIITASAYRDEFNKLVIPDDIRHELEKITIGESGYIVLLDMEGNALIHPEHEPGTNMLEFEDARGRKIIKEIVTLQNGSVRYMWANPGEEKEREKFAHFAHYPELDWIVVSTAYTHELERGKYSILAFIGFQLLVILFLIVNFRIKRKTEKKLEESNEKLNALFSSMDEIVVLHEVVFDENGNAVDYRITDCNNAFENRTGIKKEQAIGNLASEVYQVKPAPYLREFTQVGITGQTYVFDTHFAPMNKYFSISVVSTGKDKFATVTTDITSIKQAEQMIAAKNKELEQIVYVASHDLRSPLVNVEGYSQEVEFSLEDLKKILTNNSSGNEDVKKEVQTILNDVSESLYQIKISTKQMDSLLNGLLKLSRIGRAALNIQPVNMNLLLSKLITAMEYEIDTAEAAVTLSPLPGCKADKTQLNQLFTNLIGNSLKYADPSRKPEIKIFGESKNGKSIYYVEDNGIGIAKEHQKVIFELFHRLDPSGKEGDGLGLTIIKQILDRLDGTIDVESQQGKGSKFIIQLPYADPGIN